MYRKVLMFHGLSQDLDHDDFYPTEAVTELIEDVNAYLNSRPVRFAVLSGCVGVGKTTLLHKLIDAFQSSKEFTVAFMAHNDASKIKESMITNKLLRMIGEPAKRTAYAYPHCQDRISAKLSILKVCRTEHLLLCRLALPTGLNG